MNAVFHCQLCNAPSLIAKMRDVEVKLDAKRTVFVALGFRLPGQSSDAPALCDACQASLVTLAGETLETALEAKPGAEAPAPAVVAEASPTAGGKARK